MKTQPEKVLHWRCMPPRLPVVKTAVAYLLLDHFNLPTYIWIIVGAFFIFLWTIVFCRIILTEPRYPKWE